ncbi:MAG TPA: deoxyhypusine synthase family protein [Dehalococcoidia bacterium]|jgi:deoxyhypusine synthase
MQHSGESQHGGAELHRPSAAEYEHQRAEYFTSPIERLEPRPGTSGAELFRAMRRAGGPLRNLAGVYLGWEEMLDRERQAIWLTIAGAYIPFGLGGTLRAIIEHRLVDIIVTTPAQITHDLTEVRGLHHYHGTPHVDDNLLQRLDINRYWNTYGDENELNENEDVIAEFAETLADARAYTPSEYFYRLGLWLPQSRHGKADGMVTAAARQGIPIFCPSPADGDITTDLAHYRKRTGRRLLLDPVKEALDTVAVNAVVEDAGGRAGLITLGGGAPRNYGQQSMACAYMLDRRDLQKHNYGLRISLDPVETGGLSGSTISEGKTWKKYAADATVAEHYGDFMAPLVQMTQALLEVRAARPPRQGVRVRYADDGRMLVAAFGAAEVDVQATYQYA